MATEQQIKLTLEQLIAQTKRLEEINLEKQKLETERKKLEGKIGWNKTRLIQYLEANNLKKILFDKYSFLMKTLPSGITKILKDVSEFPDKYKTPPQINKRKLLFDYYRNEDLQKLVEITQRKEIYIKEIEDATVNYTNPKKGIKRISTESNN